MIHDILHLYNNIPWEKHWSFKNVDSCTLPSLCKRICWVFVTTNTLGLPSITLDRHLTHSKTTAQACSSVIGALKSWVIFANDKQPSWVSWHGVQLVSLYFVFAAILYGFLVHQLLCIRRGKMLHTKRTLNWIFQIFLPIMSSQTTRFHFLRILNSNWVRWQVTERMTCAVIARQRNAGDFKTKLDLLSIQHE